MSGLTSFVGNIGGMIAQTPLALMVAYFTWRTTFIGIGVVSIVLALLCYVIVRNSPEDMGLPSISTLEMKTIEQELQEDNGEKLPMKEGLLKALFNFRTWPGFLIFMGFFGSYVALTGTWGQSYLVEVYGMASETAPNYLMVAVIGLAIGSIVIGKVSDRIQRRKLPMIVLGSIYTLTWAVLIFVNGGKPPIILLYPLFLIMGFSCSTFVLTWACGKEVNDPRLAGISTSIVNMGGFLGGAFLPPLLGRVFDSYGTTLESKALFQKAFLYCFFFVVIGFIFIFFITETHCKNVKEK